MHQCVTVRRLCGFLCDGLGSSSQVRLRSGDFGSRMSQHGLRHPRRQRLQVRRRLQHRGRHQHRRQQRQRHDLRGLLRENISTDTNTEDGTSTDDANTENGGTDNGTNYYGNDSDYGTNISNDTSTGSEEASP